jgi:plastocyanin
MKKNLLLGMVLMVTLVALSGCTQSNTQTNSSSNLGPNQIAIQNFAFNPSTLTVKAGTTVTWTNLDSTNHPVASDTGVFNSGTLNNGQSYSYTFNQTGSYPYHCTVHPSMTGTITVEP